MTLDEMILRPVNNPYIQGLVQTSQLARIRIEGFEHLGDAATANLLSHLIWSHDRWNLLPDPDTALASMLRQLPAGDTALWNLLSQGSEVAGPKTAAWIVEALSNDANELPLRSPFVLRILWRQMGLASIPHLARCRAMDPKSSDPWLESIGEQAGIAKTIWNLLLSSVRDSRKVIRELEALMQRGAKLPLRDWKLAAEYSAHAETLRGLVFSDGAKSFFLIPDWPAEDCEVSIAHPSMFSAEQSQHWKAQVSGRKPPFSQFEASTALRLDPVGIVANPADLFLTLEGAGWVRGRAARDDGRIRTHTKTFPDIDVAAEIEYAEGVPTRFGGRWSPQTIRAYRFFVQSRGLEIAPEEVHPIALSSLMADLAPLQKTS